jgi:predicted nucleic acid-binding protein
LNKVEQIISEDVKKEIEKQLRARNHRQNYEVKKQVREEVSLGVNFVDTTEQELEEFSIDANYFKDSEIKEIKKAFRGRDVQKETGWISFCNSVLVDKLHALEKLLDELCHYLTTRDEVSRNYFTKMDVEWRMATQICGETGMGYSDAMILNMANHTTIKNIITLDYDLVYGGHVSAKDKNIITPTERLKNYKNTLKGI